MYEFIFVPGACFSSSFSRHIGHASDGETGLLCISPELSREVEGPGLLRSRDSDSPHSSCLWSNESNSLAPKPSCGRKAVDKERKRLYITAYIIQTNEK